MNACFIFREIKVAPCGKSRKKKNKTFTRAQMGEHVVLFRESVLLLANSQYSVRRDMRLSKHPTYAFKMSYLTIHKNSIKIFKK